MSEERQPTLDFLRGVAILAVVSFHAVAIFNPGIDSLRSLLLLGFQGVQLFFLVSALTMCYMWDRRAGEKGSFLKFYIRRIFRIAPPFWLAMIGYLLLNGINPTLWAPDGVGTRQIVTNFFFVSGFQPDTINAVVPGGWSIIVEITFYSIFPFFARAATLSSQSFLYSAFLAYLFNLLMIDPAYGVLFRNYAHQDLLGEFLFFQFFNQLPIFLLGISIYRAKFIVHWPFAIIVTAWLTLAFLFKALHVLHSEPLFWVGNFALFALGVAAFRLRVTNVIINYFGRLSYSMYLVHFAIVDAVSTSFSILGFSHNGLVAFVLGMSVTLGITWCVALFLRATVERGSSAMGRAVVDCLYERSNKRPVTTTNVPP